MRRYQREPPDDTEGGAAKFNWISRSLKLLTPHEPVEGTYKDRFLIARLTLIFRDKQLYTDLIACQGPDAQGLLDSFQQLLDRTDLELSFRKNLITLTQRLSSKSGLYPSCYQLKHVAQIGEYPIVSGGFADIYQGEFRGQLVCMKTTRLYQTSQVDHFLKSFWKEAILWKQLSHPNVLTIYGLFLFRKRVAIVTPWMENGNINAYLKDNTGAPRPQLAKDVAGGLSYLHDNSIIHGDLKGANILVDDSGRARLADFGISTIMDADIVSWTTSSSNSGSIRWRAPELFDVENDVSVRNSKESDVYALGCVFFEIFTGEIPFSEIAYDATVTLQVRSGARPKRPEASSASWNDFGLTEEIWTCVEECWNVTPSRRPSAHEAVRRLTTGIAKDTQPSPVVGVLSPYAFRRAMSRPFEMITIKDLKNILPKSTSCRPSASDLTEPSSEKVGVSVAKSVSSLHRFRRRSWGTRFHFKSSI